MKKSFIKFKSLLKRNIKMYFSDKLVFFISLMAPLILLLLFVLFLKNIYYNSFMAFFPEDFIFADKNIPDAFVSGWLISSLMSVTCVTVSMGTGVVMVQDKITGALNDIKTSPIKKGTLSLAYYLATFTSAIIIVFSILVLGFVYIAVVGWYLLVSDVILIILNTFLLTLFGCGISTVINSFISSDGGTTAVSALFASVYGFICGAYMPLSQFNKSFSNIFGFNPGLYSAIIYKDLFTKRTIEKLSYLPEEAIKGIKDGFDMNFYFFGNNVEKKWMWIIVFISVVVLGLIIITIANKDKLFKRKNKRRTTKPSISGD